MELISPPRLEPGDYIGIAAPASHFRPDALQQGMAVLNKMGFRTRPAPALFDRQGYLAGSDESRAADLHHLFRDPAVKGIFCARGGYGSMRLLPHLDWDLVRTHPKVFMGFSDVTVLLALFYQRSGLVTYHGPLVTELGRVSQDTQQAVVRALASWDDIIIQPARGVVVQPGAASGPLLGGNLTLFCHLLGTPFEPRVAGHLIFIEDRGEELYRIDRMLWQLYLAGWFDKIKGLVLGHFTDCGDMAGICELVVGLCNRPIPVMAGFEIGHADPNLTLPIGKQATLDTQSGTLSIHGRTPH